MSQNCSECGTFFLQLYSTHPVNDVHLNTELLHLLPCWVQVAAGQGGPNVPLLGFNAASAALGLDSVRGESTSRGRDNPVGLKVANQYDQAGGHRAPLSPNPARESCPSVPTLWVPSQSKWGCTLGRGNRIRHMTKPWATRLKSSSIPAWHS